MRYARMTALASYGRLPYTGVGDEARTVRQLRALDYCFMPEEDPAFKPIPADLAKRFTSVHTPDLLTLMGFHYGLTSGAPRNSGEMIFGDPSELNRKNTNHALKTVRSLKSGQLMTISILEYKGITYDAAITELHGLLESWKAAIEAPKQVFSSFRFYFSHAPMKGHFSIPGHFSLREAPAEAPRPPQHSSWHPLVLSFTYTAPPNGLLKNKARASREQELALFLNLLLPYGIHSPHSNWTWAVEPHEDESGRHVPETKYVQIGYLPGKIDAKELKSLITEKSSVQLIDDPACYSFIGPKGVQGFFVPAWTEKTFQDFLSLKDHERGVFLAAARHFKVAEKSRSISLSYAHVALISSIETIANQWSEHWLPTEHCEGCNQPRHKLSFRFRSFLKTYAGSDSTPLYRKFYETRSAFLHSGEFLRGEMMGIWDIGLEGSNDHMEFRHLLDLTRIAIINWLRDPMRQPAN